MMKKIIAVFCLISFLLIFSVQAKPVRVIYLPDKSVVILYPAQNSKRLAETQEQWLERVFTEMMEGTLEGLPYDDIDSAELPQSREDRDAWEGKKGKGVSINAQKVTEKNQKKLIDIEAKKLIRKQAIENLKGTGQLPEDYPTE